jgi:hypothetical protein
MPVAPSPPELADKPEVKALAQQAEDMLACAETFTVVTVADYQRAVEALKAVKSRQKQLKSIRETITTPMLAALDAARDLFRRPETLLATAEATLKRAMTRFDEAREQERREAQRKLDEAAERERHRLAQQAERAAAKGNADKAAELQDRAAMTVAPIVQQDSLEVTGISRRETWRAEITDLRALVRGVAAGDVPLAAIEPNHKFLNGQARALRSELRYAGVRAVPERTIASGSK